MLKDIHVRFIFLFHIAHLLQQPTYFPKSSPNFEHEITPIERRFLKKGQFEVVITNIPEGTRETKLKRAPKGHTLDGPYMRVWTLRGDGGGGSRLMGIKGGSNYGKESVSEKWCLCTCVCLLCF